MQGEKMSYTIYFKPNTPKTAKLAIIMLISGAESIERIVENLDELV